MDKFENEGVASGEKVPIQTATLAEIYQRQGFLDKARKVYVGLLQEDPANEDIRRRLEELDHRLAQMSSASPETVAGAGAVSPPSNRQEAEIAVLQGWLRAIEQGRRHV